MELPPTRRIVCGRGLEAGAGHRRGCPLGSQGVDQRSGRLCSRRSSTPQASGSTTGAASRLRGLYSDPQVSVNVGSTLEFGYWLTPADGPGTSATASIALPLAFGPGPGCLRGEGRLRRASCLVVRGRRRTLADTGILPLTARLDLLRNRKLFGAYRSMARQGRQPRTIKKQT